ncbi:MAG: TetR/AcrR family transcriptional regulator [Erysipelotrichaceae bacterium]|nr:TetR/AcrR family transcriptional regulator [Erysipelotrichaceae bacterium]
MSTKEKILEEALSLFSQYGYDKTSMEQIAEAVGIKAPSLYKHYKGKEDILNALIDQAEAYYEINFGSDKNIGKIPDTLEEFVVSAINRLTFTMHDPLIRKIRIFLVKEQFRNKRLARVTTSHQIDGLIRMYTVIFEEMMKKGLLKNDDPMLLAIEAICPCALYLSKVDRQPECEKEVLETVESHLRHFCRIYGK